MALTFKCEHCAKRFFLTKPNHFSQKKVCASCFTLLQQEERNKKYQEHLLKKQERRAKARKEADHKLQAQLQQQELITKQKTTQSQNKKNQPKPNQSPQDNTSTLPSTHETTTIKTNPLEQQAQEKAKIISSLLYIYVDVKRIKVIEWVESKKRIALNKEREIRQTHKGGWSQEKFQRFVKSQKRKAPEWIEQTILRQGVLRGPYDEILIEGPDESLNQVVTKITRTFLK